MNLKAFTPLFFYIHDFCLLHPPTHDDVDSFVTMLAIQRRKRHTFTRTENFPTHESFHRLTPSLAPSLFQAQP